MSWQERRGEVHRCFKYCCQETRRQRQKVRSSSGDLNGARPAGRRWQCLGKKFNWFFILLALNSADFPPAWNRHADEWQTVSPRLGSTQRPKRRSPKQAALTVRLEERGQAKQPKPILRATPSGGDGQKIFDGGSYRGPISAGLGAAGTLRGDSMAIAHTPGTGLPTHAENGSSSVDDDGRPPVCCLGATAT